MKVSPTKEVPRGKQDVLSGKPQRLWDYFKKLIRYLADSYEDLANAINYNDDRRRENRNDIDTLQNDSLFDSDLAANGGSIPEVDRQNDFSSMPLVNGDAIVESGRNSNGSYIRWADGTQIVFFRSNTKALTNSSLGSIYWSGQTSFYYPASFTSTPVISPAVKWSEDTGSIIWGGVRNASSTGVEVFAMSPKSSGEGFLGYIAWGFWK
jgi:hypothetical protein